MLFTLELSRSALALLALLMESLAELLLLLVPEALPTERAVIVMALIVGCCSYTCLLKDAVGIRGAVSRVSGVLITKRRFLCSVVHTCHIPRSMDDTVH